MTRAAELCYLPLSLVVVLLRALALSNPLPILGFGWQKERCSNLRRLRRAKPFGPGGVGGTREPRLRGLGHAGKGAVRPDNLDSNPTVVSGWCIDEILCIH